MKERSRSESAKPGIHDGHRDRMRERFSKTGFDGMQQHEILEMLLFYAIPRRNTNDIAHALIERFGSLVGVFEATEDQLMMVDGVGPQAAALIKMIVPLLHEYQSRSNDGVRFTNSDDSGKYMVKYFKGVLKERVIVMCVDSSGKKLAIETVCEGDACGVMVNCRRLVEIVLKYPLTTGIIIAHNHPGGLALPSREDLLATSELIRTMKSMNMNLVDHIIVAGDGYVSLSSSPSFNSIFNQ